MKKIKKFIYKLLYKYYKYKYNNTKDNDKLRIMYLATAIYMDDLLVDISSGMCTIIKRACSYDRIENNTNYTKHSFKEFSYKIAKEKFNANNLSDAEAEFTYWWNLDDIKHRCAYFRYLINFYKHNDDYNDKN